MVVVSSTSTKRRRPGALQQCPRSTTRHHICEAVQPSETTRPCSPPTTSLRSPPRLASPSQRATTWRVRCVLLTDCSRLLLWLIPLLRLLQHMPSRRRRRQSWRCWQRSRPRLTACLPRWMCPHLHRPQTWLSLQRPQLLLTWVPTPHQIRTTSVRRLTSIPMLALSRLQRRPFAVHRLQHSGAHQMLDKMF